MRFRRISFPVSALLSVIAIVLFFHPGLNLGIDFIGGTLLEIQAKGEAADIGKMRTTLTGLSLGDVQLLFAVAATPFIYEIESLRLTPRPGNGVAFQARVAVARWASDSELDETQVLVDGKRVELPETD